MDLGGKLVWRTKELCFFAHLETTQSFKMYTWLKEDIDGFLPSQTSWFPLIDEQSFSWKVWLINSLFYDSVSKAICFIPLSRFGCEDFMVWHFNQNSIFSVKSGYMIYVNSMASVTSQRASSSLYPTLLQWRAIWSTKLSSPKITLFLVESLKNTLLTADNLFYRKCVVSHLCYICYKEVAYIKHVLFKWKWTRSIWDSVIIYFPTPPHSIIYVAVWFTNQVVALGHKSLWEGFSYVGSYK